MDFQDTGLMGDMRVITAFKTLKDSLKSLGMESELSSTLEMTRGVQDICPDPTVIAAALLLRLPAEIEGVIERRLGKEVLDHIHAFQKHNATAYAYIGKAAIETKALCAFEASSRLATFNAAAKRFSRDLQKVQNEEMDPSNLTVPILAGSPHMYGHLLKALEGQLPAQAVQNFRLCHLETQAINDAHLSKVAMLGIPLPPIITPPNPQPFEKTGLMQDAEVKRIYEMVVSDPRVSRHHFDDAVKTAVLLSEIPAARSIDAVCVALIDISIFGMQDMDIEMMKGAVPDSTLKILSKNTVYDTSITATGMMRAAPEFRQVAFAHAIVLLQTAAADAKTLEQKIDKNAAKAEPFLRDRAKLQAFSHIGNLCVFLDSKLKLSVGTTDAPELEERFNTELASLVQIISPKIEDLRQKMLAYSQKAPPPIAGF